MVSMFLTTVMMISSIVSNAFTIIFAFSSAHFSLSSRINFPPNYYSRHGGNSINSNKNRRMRKSRRDLTTAARLATSDNVPFCVEAFTSKTRIVKVNDENATSINMQYPWTVHVNRLDQVGSSPHSANTRGAEEDSIQNKIPKLSHDITSARGWMEHLEQCEGPIHGVGAYTVLRCDLVGTSGECKWLIWGMDYHLERMFSSYEMFMNSLNVKSERYSTMEAENQSSYYNAASREELKNETCDVIRALLQEAKMALSEAGDTKIQSVMCNNKLEVDGSSKNTQPDQEKLMRTLMVTVLWTPSQSKSFMEADSVKVKPSIRGHAAFAGSLPLSSSMQNNGEEPLATPISACLAIPKDASPESLALLPHRHLHDECNKDNWQKKYPPNVVGASAKISSWCRVRRPLEDPNRFKAPQSGVGEVLLVRQSEELLAQFHTQKHSSIINSGGSMVGEDFINSLEMLEGLTSNLFVIYKDGTVRTAPSGLVLSGYARHLVIEVIKHLRSGEISTLLLMDDARPPTINDAINGLWSEVFVTSAIRLIIPVERILIPAMDSGNDSKETEHTILWQAADNVYGPSSLTRAIRSAIYSRGFTQATSC